MALNSKLGSAEQSSVGALRTLGYRGAVLLPPQSLAAPFLFLNVTNRTVPESAAIRF